LPHDVAVKNFLSLHKAKIARVTALAGLLTVGLVLVRGLPRPLDIELQLGPKHAEVVSVRIDYLRGGEELQWVELSFPSGAPQRVHHSVSVSEGDVQVRAELKRADGARISSSENLHAPADGTVLIQIDDSQGAAGAAR
jgi:hypothetical protein